MSLPAGAQGRTAKPATRAVVYKRLHTDAVDFVPLLLYAAGMHFLSIADEISEAEDAVIVNTLGTAVPQIVARLRAPLQHEAVILADAANAERLQSYGRVLTLPMSSGAWNEICSGACFHAEEAAAAAV